MRGANTQTKGAEMYGPQELDRNLLGHRVRIWTNDDICQTEVATIVRSTASGMIKVRTDDGDFLWGNQWEEA